MSRARAVAACWGLLVACASLPRSEPGLAPPAPKPPLAILRSERVAHSPQDELLPAVSLDGRTLAYVSSESGNLEVSVRDLLLSASHPLTDSAADDADPSFAPSGRRLVFMSRRFDAKGDLLIVPVEGGTPERLTDEATADRQPVYAADEQRIYYTASAPIGLEHIAVFELSSRTSRRLSPTAGFDPVPSADGKYLVYTAPGGVGGAAAPHLVLLRLSDTTTRALTLGEAPAGFAKLTALGDQRYRVIFVRFPDDDNEDGVVDGSDQASLWALDVDAGALFGGKSGAVSPPWPLTSGAKDELFPEPRGPWLYFTETADGDQNVVRLPLRGMFPVDEAPSDQLASAANLLDRRERWFALRAIVARTQRGEPVRARALLAIADLQRDSGHPRLLSAALAELAEDTKDAPPRSELDEIAGLCSLEQIAASRKSELAEAATLVERERALRSAQQALREVEARYAWSEPVVARAALELVELDVERGRRLLSVEALGGLVKRYHRVPGVAARALLRRTELLDLSFDPRALGEAYAEVAVRFPSERAIVREASARAVRSVLEASGDDAGPVAIDALRRLLLSTPAPPIRFAARERLIELLEATAAPSLASVEAHALAQEALAGGDRLLAAQALGRAAALEEAQGDLDAAFESLRVLKRDFADAPGELDRAEAALTRVAMSNAARAKAAQKLVVARDLYAAVVANDPTVLLAYRSYFALAAATGALGPALAEAEAAARREPKAPIRRYVYALALTYRDPPDLRAAKVEVDTALALNPELAPAYLLRGWIQEMLESKESSGYLEGAIDSYQRAYRIAKNSLDRELELDALLDLGNAKWRLGDQTNDATNLELAAKDWVEFLSLGGVVESPLGALVFWERLGRAAAWSADYALSVTASREALALAEHLGRQDRLGQIYGNLALAYTGAGETAYADEAFQQLLAASEGKAKASRLAIAERNLAMGKLARRARTGEGELSSVLVDLATSRRLLPDADLGALIPAPGGFLNFPVLSMTVPDGSRAPLGFLELVELDLNLSLASAAHRQRGEGRRASELDERRLRLLDQILGEHVPITLNVLREQLGLRVAEALRRCQEDALEACRRGFTEALSGLDRSIKSGPSGDQPALIVDRAKTVAIVGETEARLSAQGRALGVIADLPARLEEERLALEGLASVVLGKPGAGGLSSTLTSSTALLEAPSVLLEATAVLARLEHAKGLLLMTASEEQQRPGTDLRALLGELDRGVDRLQEARRSFARAAALAARVEAPVGARTYAAARHALELLDARAPVRSGTTAAELPAASALGADDSALEPLASRALAGDAAAAGLLSEALKDSLAGLLPARHDALLRWLTQTASGAVALADPAAALERLDRALLYRLAARGTSAIDQAKEPGDGAVLRSVRAPLARLVGAEAELRPVEGEEAATTARRRAEGQGRIRAAKRELSAAKDAALGRSGKALGSSALAARLFAEGAPAADIQGVLGPSEALLAPLVLGDQLHWVLVEGATTTMSLISSRSSFSSLVSDLRALAGPPGQLSPTAAVGRVRAALEEALGARLGQLSALVLADAALEVPIPAPLVLPGLPVSHVSAPTALLVSAQRLPLGAKGVVSIGPEGAAAPSAQAEMLGPEEALALASAPRPRPKGAAPPARTGADRLRGRAVSVVVIQGPVTLEPGALEASQTWVGPGRPSDLPPEGRFERELLLGSIDLPARAWVLTDVQGPLRAEALSLDLALAYRAPTTVVAIPSAVDRAAAARIAARVAADASEVGVAKAVAQVVAELLPQHPAVAGVLVIGAPGVDKAREAELAKASLGLLRQRLFALGNQGRFAEVAEKVQEVLRFQDAAGEHADRMALYTLGVTVLARLERWHAAAELQAEAVAFVEQNDPSPKGKAQAIQGRLALGGHYAMARDFERAKAELDRAIRDLEAQGDSAGLAAAYRKLAEVERERPDFKAAAAAYGRSVEAYEALKACSKPDSAKNAADTMRNLGRLLMEQLSDSARAKPVFLKARACGDDKAREASLLCDLAEAARRRGLFDEATGYVEDARKLATQIKRPELEIRAVIEAANIAWYRGDVAGGAELCAQSKALAEARLKEVRADKRADPKGSIRNVIYAYSACGLLEMSAGNGAAAERTLLKAVRMAGVISADSDAASQYNNLGRVYLESGRVDDAIESFERAEKLDRAGGNFFGLAYDQRNLGTALLVRGRMEDAAKALQSALVLSAQAQDDNNRLRALFALGELERQRGQPTAALAAYREAEPLAAQLENRELEWQVQRALALLAQGRGESQAAEEGLLRSAETVRRLSGQGTSSELAPPRYSAFDDLLLLLLATKRPDQAFAVSEAARGLAASDRLDDRRVPRLPPGLLSRVRQARTGTAGVAALAELTLRAPGIAARLRPTDPRALAATVPADALILDYRPTASALVIFGLGPQGLLTTTVAISAQELGARIAAYELALVNRGDTDRAGLELKAALIDPVSSWIKGARRLAVVLQGGLRRVPLAALPLGGGEAMIDRYTIIGAVDPAAAAGALQRSGGPATGALALLGGAKTPDHPPLDFVPRELEAIREARPKAELFAHEQATRARLSSALGARETVHFAGHAEASASDPLASSLLAADGPLPLWKLLGIEVGARLVVLSACATLPPAGADRLGLALNPPLSLAEGLLLAGAEAVVSSSTPVDDVSSALFMKHLHRQLLVSAPAEALRAAALAVRQRNPHPAWWASYSLLYGATAP